MEWTHPHFKRRHRVRQDESEFINFHAAEEMGP
jgi:hypothetical protein